ncbi:adhesion G protein-coupled receptor E5 isoform X3 [Thunnus albacares]|uniref:adhesion G protein-coupled receptor E5 isoform X2 n=1 Tax=Thunnus albacares TaxID=8236 RepID=UPI001CF6C6C7|nr:adhesion G protein-coupled receptor E5 isoform X2 [Thunnus albacares]XP_044201929.1 adhesion G protein-coupled receptor E5 isoform X3 [Thunnus albacares]
MGPGKALLILGLMCMLGECFSKCPDGFGNNRNKCEDINECEENKGGCGERAVCFNTVGSHYCQCKDGFANKNKVNFTMGDGQCQDINECYENKTICGHKADCINQIGSYKCTCHSGYTNPTNDLKHCIDIDECKEAEMKKEDLCGIKGTCKNNNGSYWCMCPEGYMNYGNESTPCSDIDECKEAEMKKEDLCGIKGTCKNNNGSYWCMCPEGYMNYGNESTPCSDIDECKEAEMKKEDLCGIKGTCKNNNGSYRCMCPKGYTHYGNERTPCSQLDCETFQPNSSLAQSLKGLEDISSMMRDSCLALSNPHNASEGKTDGDALLEKLLTAIEAILSPGHLNHREDMSGFLQTVEKSIRHIGPQLKGNGTEMETTEIVGAKIAVQRGKTQPTGPILLTNENARLDTDWTTAAGTGTYPGFALAALLTYKNLEKSVNNSFEELKGHEKNAKNPSSFKISSKVVSVVVSNPSTQNLSSPVNITLRHLNETAESSEVEYICAYWNDRGAWSEEGCHQQQTNATHTVCTCEHLSSFAVLMALYPMTHPFALILITKIGLTMSLLCLVLCILTFKFCRSIQGTRTTIHLHLCVCLFVADLIFLAGISKTEPVGGCRFAAAMLHIFFLGVFMWMLLEGVQLYRMVVLVFNATIRPLYLFIAGYGTPLVIVIISAIVNPKGYGTKEHCWLSLKDGFIWSFFGPVCCIIFLNVFFFIITVWKLAQKFTSLNPDLSTLNKIKAFTVTAIAQLCILGLMWVFGAFLFEEGIGTTVAAYLFTILNSLQGALIFVMHCLLSKQVREEYAYFLSCICTPQKKRYSDLSSTNPSSSQSRGSQSGQHTGESQI